MVLGDMVAGKPEGNTHQGAGRGLVRIVLALAGEFLLLPNIMEKGERSEFL